MSDRYFVDTNILMYAHDSEAGVKHRRAREIVEELWNDRSGVVSTQVLQELCFNLRRKLKHPLDLKATREVIADYLRWHVIINDAESVLDALSIEESDGISFWDALIIQAARAAGALLLYTEDLGHGQIYSGVHVINPLT